MRCVWQIVDSLRAFECYAQCGIAVFGHLTQLGSSGSPRALQRSASRWQGGSTGSRAAPASPIPVAAASATPGAPGIAVTRFAPPFGSAGLWHLTKTRFQGKQTHWEVNASSSVYRSQGNACAVLLVNLRYVRRRRGTPWRPATSRSGSPPWTVSLAPGAGRLLCDTAHFAGPLLAADFSQAPPWHLPPTVCNVSRTVTPSMAKVFQAVAKFAGS